MGKKGGTEDPMADQGWPMNRDNPYVFSPEYGVPCPFPQGIIRYVVTNAGKVICREYCKALGIGWLDRRK